MTLGREARLRELGLWPVWRARASPSAVGQEHVTPVVSDASVEVSQQALVEKHVMAKHASCHDLDWNGLAAAVSGCSRCALHTSRTQGVLGVGDVHAEWLIIGEAPGAEEDRQGQPFVGQAGKLLDAMLAAISLQRGHNVYIANVLKSRPPGNRDPKPEEVAACLPYLERQIDLIQPKIMVALGRFAAQSLLLTDTPIGRMRGRVHEYRGIPLVVTYHPAYLLRNPADKAKVWEDLLLAVSVARAAR